MTKSPFYGDALSTRPRQRKHGVKFKAASVNAGSLDSVRVDVSESATPGTYSSTSMPGTEFERMRRYALVLAKWSYPNVTKAAKQFRVAPPFVEMANRIVANTQFRHTFGEDPTTGTVNIKPFVTGLLSDNANEELIAAVMGLAGTQAFTDIMAQVGAKDPAVAQHLNDCAKAIHEYMNSYYEWADCLHGSRRNDRRRAEYYYRSIAHYGDNAHELVRREKNKRKGHTKPGSTKRGEKPAGDTRIEPRVRDGKVIHPHKTVVPISEYNDGGWFTPYLAKHELVLPHTGKAGRRLIPTNEGKYPKAFYRMVTDPYRRIFQRKTRALGGVVVFDCSGSMGLDDDDIDRVMKSSAGCSIVCYSASHDEEQDAVEGNIHLVARHGRRARHLPDFPGGNGVDLPALKWAYYNLRLNSKSPVIWVSDGQVTGVEDRSSASLVRETNNFIKRKGIIQVHSPNEAVTLLHKLQRRKMS